MKLILAMTMLLSFSSFAKDRAINCEIGDDAHGGKWCHYVLSQCDQEADCDEAAFCAVSAHNKSFVGDEIFNIDTAVVGEKDGITTVIAKSYLKNGSVKKRTVTLEKVGDQCRPITVK